MKHLVLFTVLSLLAGSACKPLMSLIESGEDVPAVAFEPYYDINPAIEPDPDIDAYLQPFREQLHQEMQNGVTRAGSSFNRREIGYLTADMLRFRAAHEYQGYVHLGLVDNDDVRIELAEGIITLGDLHEFVPYDQTLVIVKISGNQVLQLANELAGRAAAPVSGMRFTVNSGQARGVLVDGGIVSPDSTYFVATTNTLAETGGGYQALQNVELESAYPLLIRDIVIDYLSARQSVTPLLDQRIRSL